MICSYCGKELTTDGCDCVSVNNMDYRGVIIGNIDYKLSLLLKLLIVDKTNRKDEYNWEHLDLYKLESDLVKELRNVLDIKELKTCDMTDGYNLTVEQLRNYFSDLKEYEKRALKKFIMEPGVFREEKLSKLLNLIEYIAGID